MNIRKSSSSTPIGCGPIAEPGWSARFLKAKAFASPLSK